MSYKDSINELAKGIPVKNCSFLITGSTGLIGSCIIDTLICANECYGANNIVYALGRSEEKIRSRFGNKVFPVGQDICEKIQIDNKINFIIHAASNADPRTYVLCPVDTIMTNIL